MSDDLERAGDRLPAPQGADNSAWRLPLQALLFTLIVAAGAVALAAGNLESANSIADLQSQALAAGSEAAGYKVFEAQKCALCHSVEALGVEAKTKSEKLRGKDLSKIGSERDEPWLSAFLKREKALDGSPHKKEFKGSDEELQALVAWLLEQKAPPDDV